MKQAIVYSLKVWLTSVVVTPFLVLLTGLVGKMGEGVGFALAMLMLGTLFSLPSFLLLSLACWALTRMQRKIVMIKVELTLIGVLLTYIPFFIINDYAFLINRDELSRTFFVVYSLLITFGIWFYTFKGASKEQINIPDSNISI